MICLLIVRNTTIAEPRRCHDPEQASGDSGVPMTCPACKVDREVVAEMLGEGRDSENYWTAMAIARSCSDCQDFFEELAKANVDRRGRP